MKIAIVALLTIAAVGCSGSANSPYDGPKVDGFIYLRDAHGRCLELATDIATMGGAVVQWGHLRIRTVEDRACR